MKRGSYQRKDGDKIQKEKALDYKLEELFNLSKTCKICGEVVETKVVEKPNSIDVKQTHFCTAMHGECVLKLTYSKKS